MAAFCIFLLIIAILCIRGPIGERTTRYPKRKRSASNKRKIHEDDIDGHLNATTSESSDLDHDPKVGTTNSSKSRPKSNTRSSSKGKTKHRSKYASTSDNISDEKEAKNIHLSQDSETEIFLENEFVTPEFPKSTRKSRRGRVIKTPLRSEY